MSGKSDTRPGDNDARAKPSGRRRALVGSSHVLLALAVVGTVVHHTIRDGWPASAPIFYLVPPAAALVASLPAFGLALRDRARLRLVISIAALTGAGFGVWRWDYRPAHSAAATDGDDRRLTRVVAWNLADAFWGVEIAGDGVEQLAADVAVLFESPTPDESREIFGQRFPGCVVAPFADDGLVIVNGSIADVYKKSLQGGSVALIEIEVREGDFSLAIIDLSSTAFSSRESDLEEAAAAIRRWRGGEPVILVASVHMPRHSALLERHLGNLELRETFLDAGSGLGTGWPAWLPLYHCEQFWVSTELEVKRTSAEWSLRSDHLPWVLEVGVR